MAQRRHSPIWTSKGSIFQKRGTFCCSVSGERLICHARRSRARRMLPEMSIARSTACNDIWNFSPRARPSRSTCCSLRPGRWFVLLSPPCSQFQFNAPRFVSRKASTFVRYCRQQANKYGIKGSRVAAARQALAVLAAAEATYGSVAKLAAAEVEVTALASSSGHTAVADMTMQGGQVVRHLEVCGKRMPFTSSIKSAREIVERMLDEYGQRALHAERNEGVDWKALSHAVRVGREAIELFETGRIIFPLRDAAEIRAIRRGDLKYAAVAEIIDELLVAVEVAAAATSLREEPDKGFIDELVAQAYRGKILGET